MMLYIYFSQRIGKCMYFYTTAITVALKKQETPAPTKAQPSATSIGGAQNEGKHEYFVCLS